MKKENDKVHLAIARLNKLEKELLAREKRYRDVVEDLTEVISRFKKDGTLTFVNETYCRFFGIVSEKAVGRKWHPVAYEDDVGQIEKELQMLSKDHPVVVIENRVWDAQGNLVWMQFVNRGFFNGDGELCEVQSVGRDITELKEKETLIIERDREIRQKSAELEKFNTALEVLLEQRNRQMEALKENIYKNYNRLILPELNALMKFSEKSAFQKRVFYIIHVMENILVPGTALLASEKFGLTKTELKVAAMIKNDMTTDEIAALLNVSTNTINFHRKNIRAKLGITRSNTNLSLRLKGCD